FAIDPANWKQGDDLVVARSCITCHTTGINGSRSDTNIAGQNGWTSQADLDTFYGQIRGKFQASMRQIVSALSADSPLSDGTDLNQQLINGTIEPISKAIELVEGSYKPSSNDCSFFCNGKYSTRNPLCETTPVQQVHK